ncbi:hypothetical protein BH09ACT7_BH09ACT7_21120 [soil metagenome]
MTRPTVSQAHRWRPEALTDLADGWDSAAGRLQAEVDGLTRATAQNREQWTGAAAGGAWGRLAEISSAATTVVHGLTAAAAAARDGASRIGRARDAVLTAVADARAGGYSVADDGTVSAPEAGAGTGITRGVMATRATDLVHSALDALGAADTDVARAIEAALTGRPNPAPTQPTGAWPVSAADIAAGWPSMSQDRISAQIAAMTPAQKQQLIDTMPAQVGNTDGIPWEMRIAANRINIADAIADAQRTVDLPDEDKLRRVAIQGLDPASAERVWVAVHADPRLRAAAIATHDAGAKQRIAFYQGLLAEIPDPTGRGHPPSARQILAFDPERSSLVELTGDLNAADSVGVLVPGLNTTMLGSTADTDTVQRFVAAGGGRVAMITYLGGPFPAGDPLTGVFDAADPHYATDMAPRLVAFSEDVNRTVDATGRTIPVTYIGHSYGGSILGTAESAGLTADRTIYVEAAGAGVGVHDPGDWHNRNPDVVRFSMTAPGDPIEAVQGSPLSPHGADPDEMPGVTRLETGRRVDGSVLRGLPAHSDVLTDASDAWRNILGVITGDRNVVGQR